MHASSAQTALEQCPRASRSSSPYWAP